MSPKIFIATLFLIAIIVLFVEWLRDWRDFPRLSPTRDKSKPIERFDIEDGRPKPSVTDVDDVVAEASCGGDASSD